jgi:hypothetical protein
LKGLSDIGLLNEGLSSAFIKFWRSLPASTYSGLKDGSLPPSHDPEASDCSWRSVANNRHQDGLSVAKQTLWQTIHQLKYSLMENYLFVYGRMMGWLMQHGKMHKLWSRRCHTSKVLENGWATRSKRQETSTRDWAL